MLAQVAPVISSNSRSTSFIAVAISKPPRNAYSSPNVRRSGYMRLQQVDHPGASTRSDLPSTAGDKRKARYKDYRRVPLQAIAPDRVPSRQGRMSVYCSHMLVKEDRGHAV